MPRLSDAVRREEQRLVDQILESRSSKKIISTTLRTDERVIARVTDGIYRQPASALRELISNSYDADATHVVVSTDAPRFSQILIEDNGHGMSPQVVAHVLMHIGGSAKRSEQGPELGVTSADPLRSPGGRRLIGKIGIGLFSVSQLTQTFQIITKVKGDAFRTVASVVLRQFSDQIEQHEKDTEEGFESGRVKLWREPATDIDSQGTTVVLTNLRQQARDTLRSREIWAAVEQSESAQNITQSSGIAPPKFHVGRLDVSSDELIKRTGDGRFDTLPWNVSDDPSEAFRKLVNVVWHEVYVGNTNPQLEKLFDYYLRMVWQLGLAVPLPYVDGHIFDIPIAGEMRAFLLSNNFGGTAEQISLPQGASLRAMLSLTDPDPEQDTFDVFVDDVKLLRPVKFTHLPMTNHAIKSPLVFVGKCREEFPGIPIEFSGGPLEFEAYLFWTPKVAPTEHQGSLIRIHGSSGTLFDPTFMRYQVAELTRLHQTTCEIFVREGLDSALNIDRESFNHAHPHSVYITRWLHNAFRQLSSAQKKRGQELRSITRQANQEHTAEAIQDVALDVWQENADDEASLPPEIVLIEDEPDTATTQSTAGTYVFSKTKLLKGTSYPNTQPGRSQRVVLENKMRAIAQVLAAFGLLDGLGPAKQERLLQAIQQILSKPSN